MHLVQHVYVMFCACNCRITNHCSSVVNFSWQQFATAEEEFDSAAADISDILKETSTRPMRPGQQDVLDSLSSGAVQIPKQLLQLSPSACAATSTWMSC